MAVGVGVVSTGLDDVVALRDGTQRLYVSSLH